VATIQNMKQENKDLKYRLGVYEKRISELQDWKREAEEQLTALAKELSIYTQVKINDLKAQAKKLAGRTIITPEDADFDPKPRVQIINPNAKKTLHKR
jgi:hypothetical protein